MAAGESFYPPVDRCIYCGATAPTFLGQEHIIPYSLNGALVLPKASCRQCSAKTHRYEGVVTRGSLANFRARFGVQTRNKRDRPTHVTFGTKTPSGATG